MNSERDEPFEVEELDAGDGEDLEAAMKEALEAVESAVGDPGSESEDSGAVDTTAVVVEDDESDGGVPDELALLRREVAELRDRSVRTLADFDNFRKRAERERGEQQRYAGAEVLRDMLEIVDNLERARDSSGGFEDLKDGVELIVRQVADLLRRHGVVRVDADGRAFDPAVHEAVSRDVDSGVTVPTVTQELQAGYVMKDRLLRPSMVVVAVPAPAPTEADNAD